MESDGKRTIIYISRGKGQPGKRDSIGDKRCLDRRYIEILRDGYILLDRQTPYGTGKEGGGGCVITVGTIVEQN